MDAYLIAISKSSRNSSLIYEHDEACGKLTWILYGEPSAWAKRYVEAKTFFSRLCLNLPEFDHHVLHISIYINRSFVAELSFFVNKANRSTYCYFFTFRILVVCYVQLFDVQSQMWRPENMVQTSKRHRRPVPCPLSDNSTIWVSSKSTLESPRLRIPKPIGWFDFFKIWNLI